MPGDNAVGIIDQNRVCKSELRDCSRKLVDLLLGVGSGIALARIEGCDVLINNGQVGSACRIVSSFLPP